MRLALALLLWSSAALAQTPQVRQVGALKITVLSTMLTDTVGIGEWGFSALVEVDGHKLLFDTGARPDTVATNARELGIDLSQVSEVLISHNHGDHTGGLLALRRALFKKNPAALSVVHVGRGAFYPRDPNRLLSDRSAYLATGGRFVEHASAAELWPGVWITGPVPRVHPERNWSGSGTVQTPAGSVEDNVPEDQSLVFDTAQGLVLLSGCGHAGVINTAEYARKVVRAAPLHAAVGGFHLFNADDKTLTWTVGKLRELGLQALLGAHCTGLEPVYRMRTGANLDRKHCLVGSVGSSFSLSTGIDPRPLAH